MSVHEHQSDGTEAPLVWIRTLCQRLIVSPCPEPVFLVIKCLSCGQFSLDLLMSPKRSVAAPCPTTAARHRNHHDRRLSNGPVPAGITRPKVQQPYSRACVLKPPAESCGPNEAVGDRVRRSHQNHPRRWRRRGVQNGHRTRRQSSGCGTSSRRRVMSMASSASPGCWTFDELLVFATSASLLDRAFRALATRKLYQQTLQHFLTVVANRNFVDFGRRTNGCGSDNVQQRSVHVWSGLSLGQHTDGCPHAQISPFLKTRRWHATKIPLVFARLEIAHTRSHAKSVSPKRVVINPSKTGVGGSSAHGRFFPDHVVQLRPAFGTSSFANATAGTADLLGDKFVAPPHCATRKWTMHTNPSCGCLHPLGLEDVPMEGRVLFAHGRQGSSRFPFSHHQFQTTFIEVCQSLNLQNITLDQARHSGSSIDRAMNVRPLCKCKLRGQWRTDQSVLWRCLVERES